MTKEQLKQIKNNVKATIIKLYNENAPIELSHEQMFEKIRIISSRVEKLCNNNREMGQGVIMLALEELKREASGGDFNYILNKLTNGG